MLITTILILVMMVIVGSTINVAGMQWDMAYLQKNTSNTYYLAKSGIEKGTDVINKAIQAQIPVFIEEIRYDYLEQLTDINKVRTNGQDMDFYYSEDSDTEKKNKKMKYRDSKFVIDEEVISKVLRDKIYSFVSVNYFGKKIEYKVQADRQTATTATEIVVEFKDLSPADPSKLEFKIICTAKTKDGADIKEIKTVEALIHIEMPKNIDNEIHEAYEWLYNPPEVLDSAITCFSDVVVTDGGKLTVIGDMRVKGTRKETQVVGGVLQVPDMSEIGGVIASNGGQIEVKTPDPSPADANKSTNTGSIYCIGNVATTHGWEPEEVGINSKEANYTRTAKSKIIVNGDVVANTLAIFDDLYGGGYNQTLSGGERVVNGNEIEIAKNVFVDNDVRIDKYVKSSKITAAGSLFGISDGTIGPRLEIGGTFHKDPNSSSGIFNRGSDSHIKADGMFVNGQPYIDFGEGLPYALWESIGEPFEAVRSTYLLDPSIYEGTNAYLSSEAFRESIKVGQIEITDPYKTYVPGSSDPHRAYISAKSPTYYPTGETWLPPTGRLLDAQNKAKEFFYQGGSSILLSSLTDIDNDYNSESYLFDDINSYYNGEKALGDKKRMYFKNYNPTLSHLYKGLRGYMTAKRSIFYGSFDAVYEAPRLLHFSDVLDLSGLSTSQAGWSYETPIEIVDGGVIDIGKYYVQDEKGDRPYPTIIINHSPNVLEITGSNGKVFKGIIISKGNVQIKSNALEKGKITLEGSIIIGGSTPVGDVTREAGGAGLRQRDKIMLGQDVGLSVSGSEVDVTIIHNTDMLLKMNVADKVLFRTILDALKITQFKDNENIATILGPYTSEALRYTQGRVKLSNRSILDVTTQNIRVKIKTMRKVND